MPNFGASDTGISVSQEIQDVSVGSVVFKFLFDLFYTYLWEYATHGLFASRRCPQEHMEMQRAQYLMNNTACPPGSEDVTFSVFLFHAVCLYCRVVSVCWVVRHRS